MVAPLNYTVLLHSRPVADLERGGRGLRLSFRGEYLDDEARVPLSLSLPAETGLHQGDAVARWIDGLLPGRREVRERWRDHYGAASADAFDLLSTRVGHDCAGAVQFSAESGEGRPVGPPPRSALAVRGGVRGPDPGDVAPPPLVGVLAQRRRVQPGWRLPQDQPGPARRRRLGTALRDDPLDADTQAVDRRRPPPSRQRVPGDADRPPCRAGLLRCGTGGGGGLSGAHREPLRPARRRRRGSPSGSIRRTSIRPVAAGAAFTSPRAGSPPAR